MSSSSSAPIRRVLRAAAAAAAASDDEVLHLDLRPEGLRRLDPRRVDDAVAEGRVAGYEAGRQAGLAAGHAAAAEQTGAIVAASRNRLDRLLEAAEEVLQDAERYHRAALDELAGRVSELAFAVAEAVVGRELEIASSVGQDAVARAIAAAGPGDTEVVVHLNPADARALDLESISNGRAITVVGDEAITPGDCLARVGTTTIDARIGAALNRVRAVLSGAPA